ncbi:PREDICTED: WD repeat-containing protein 91-like [Ceratotherium simum simum]|uniref:WD repeat-containing protein 91-like n=1 Tax=Ceratotherium simum simum TaxID=73337 RepID=A0ABM1CUN9_CERSS|nr:PREDICTED: WD repeat-containing protein 91-like [Ceratotherium simum simum]
MAEAVERTDEPVREYLLFRGFTRTLRQLDAEIKADKERGFRVDKIVDQLQQLMQLYDLAALRDCWSYLELPVILTFDAECQRTNQVQEENEVLRQKCVEKKPEASGPEGEPCPELHMEALETLTWPSTAGPEGGGVRPEQLFIVLGQEEYGEHHSSIMHCRVDCSGWRVTSLDLDGVIKVWSFSPIMQTKASSVSKLPLLSLEWATKWDRLVSNVLPCCSLCSLSDEFPRALHPALPPQAKLRQLNQTPSLLSLTGILGTTHPRLSQWASVGGCGVGTVHLYDMEAKKNLCEITVNDDMPT